MPLLLRFLPAVRYLSAYLSTFRSGIIRTAFTAGTAGAATGAVSAASAFSSLFVADHTANQKSNNQRKHSDQSKIDKIGRKPVQHTITSLKTVAALWDRRA